MRTDAGAHRTLYGNFRMAVFRSERRGKMKNNSDYGQGYDRQNGNGVDYYGVQDGINGQNGYAPQGVSASDQSYYGPQGGSADGRSYYGPQGGNGNGQSYYGPQGGNGNGQSYYGPQGGNGNGQSYYGPQGGNINGQSYYGPQGGNGNGQNYYGPQGGNGNGQNYYGPQGGAGAQNYYGPQGEYDGGPSDGKKEKKKKKKKRRKLIFVLELLLLLILAVGLFGFAQLGRIDRVKLSDILVNNGIGKSGYRNIALFGVDSREGQLDSGTNSDTIMVASINQKTGDIKLVSVYRDTYLDNTNGEYRKATECYAGGGAERAINMLNKNLDLDIEDFVTVDFSAVIEAVDLVGGVEIEITEEERGWLNGYLVETSQVTGKEYTTVDSAGYQNLTGIQAMAYCRIRYTTGWDYKRTERQRLVLEKIFEKAKSKGVTDLTAMVNTMIPYISTSLSNTEILSLALGITKYSIADTTGFPFTSQAANISAGDCVVPQNLSANVTQLHEYLFGETNYTPSETVQEISYKIINDTGIQ